MLDIEESFKTSDWNLLSKICQSRWEPLNFDNLALLSGACDEGAGATDAEALASEEFRMGVNAVILSWSHDLAER